MAFQKLEVGARGRGGSTEPTINIQKGGSANINSAAGKLVGLAGQEELYAGIYYDPDTTRFGIVFRDQREEGDAKVSVNGTSGAFSLRGPIKKSGLALESITGSHPVFMEGEYLILDPSNAKVAESVSPPVEETEELEEWNDTEE